MNLTRKTLLYTILISLILTVFFTAYLVWLLPGLYVEHVNRQYVSQFEELHLKFVQNDQYLGVADNPMSNSVSVVFPKSKGDIRIYSRMAELQLKVKDKRLEEKLDLVREKIKKAGESADFQSEENLLSEIITEDEIANLFSAAIDALPVEIVTLHYTPFTLSDDSLMYDAKRIGENTSLVAVSGSYDANEYVNLVAITDRGQEYVFSIASVVTGSIGQILPVTLQSLPMILLVMAGIAVAASYLFSDRIVRPITAVSAHAREMMESGYEDVPSLDIRSNDEIGQLAQDLDALYLTLQKQFRDLAHEHHRQEVFLRAGSHQLKTPLTASMLLVDGMIHRVGKYQDIEAYLPKVRTQLKQMQQMVESLLALQSEANEMQIEPVDLESLLKIRIHPYQELADKRSIRIEMHGNGVIMGDVGRLEKILDSLIGNAIQYTEVGGRVVILLENGIEIRNTPAIFDEEVFAHVMKPFVSSHLEPGRGLGLYIAKNYAAMQGLDLQMKREQTAVSARLFPAG